MPAIPMPEQLPLFLGLGAGALLVVLAIRWRIVVRYRRAMKASAERLGLTFSARDPFKTRKLPLKLIRRFGGRVNNVLWGDLDGTPARIFQYWYSRSSGSDDHRTTHHYTCGLIQIPAEAPHLVLYRENLFTRIGRKLGFGGVQVGPEEFDRTFRVRCKDEQFARLFLTPELRNWLVGLEGRWAFEVLGRHLLCMRRGRLRPDDVSEVVTVLTGIHHRLPPSLHHDRDLTA